jgi:2-keto-4-pentenoate hydratase
MLTIDPRVRDGMALQLEQWRRALNGGARRIGWKLGRGIEEVEALMGTRPVLGHLTSTTMLRSGDTYDASGSSVLRAETELTIEIRRRVEAREDEAGARDAIAGFRVATELVDLGPPRGDVAAVIGANVFHRAYAMGPLRPPLPTEGRRATLTVNGETGGEGTLLDDYAATILDAAALLAQFGEALEPGDRVLAGSAVHVPVAAGDHIRAAIDGLGHVEVTVAA